MIIKKLNKSGFTLIETIMVIVVLGILASIGVAAMLEMANSIAFINKREPTRSEFRLIASKITRDFRRLRNETSINNATSGLIDFIDNAGNAIIYSLSGTVLTRTENGTPYTLSNQVPAFGLSYYDDYGVSVTPAFVVGIPTNIRLIRTDLTIQDNAGNLQQDFQVRPRNNCAVGRLFW
jgi:prepilin-type N-terminal cleavage/methylation domain-containing protein